MQYLSKGDDAHNKKAKTLLEEAETLTGKNSCIPKSARRSKLRAVTLNNLGCFYKQMSKPHTAHKYLERALEIEATTPECDNPAGTHLNLCAILSQLGRHAEALEHAECALELLSDGTPSSEKNPATSITAIAYYNKAVEQEYLRLGEQALKSYSEAFQVAAKELGQKHPLAMGMKKSWNACKRLNNPQESGLYSPRSPRSRMPL